MNKAIKNRWIKALRSGKYTQGPQVLKLIKDNGTKHCCLGVLCELAIEDGILVEHSSSSPIGFQKFGSNDEYCLLPEEVRKWAGISKDRGLMVRIKLKDDPMSSLTKLNDNGTPFDKIANIIKSEL